MVRWHWAVLGLVVGAPALAGDLSFGVVGQPGPGEKPALIVTPALPLATLDAECEAGGQTTSFHKTNIAAGTAVRLELPRDPSVTAATCDVAAEFAAGHTEGVSVPITWSYAMPLEVRLDRAVADLAARTLTVEVTAPVDRADVIAYGAHKTVLSEESVPLDAGPGTIAVPWVGDPSDVVLLDVTLHSGGSWSGFTYSPWFLDIDHDDVHFESDQAEIPTSEEPKLEATLVQLRDVLDKYGDIVPVKLYIAGCTDTVGSAEHNLDLSRRRAHAIAKWLRAHGYSMPIYYNGFGESWLATATGDNVDSPANRRAVYMVGAVPPPPSTGVPQVRWTAL